MSSRRLQSCIVMALLTTSASAFANGTGSGVLPGPDRSFAIDMDLTNDAASTSDVVSIILDGSTNDAFPILWCTIGSVFSPPGATTTAGGVGTQTVTFNFMDAPDGFNPGETLSLVGIDPDGDPGPVGVSIGEMIGVEVTFVYEDGCVYRGVFVDDPRPGAGLVLARVPIGKSYCGPGVPNSTGLPGSLACNGSDIAADEDVTLVASDLPPGNVCLFLASVNQGLIQPPRSCGPASSPLRATEPAKGAGGRRRRSTPSPASGNSRRGGRS